MKIVTRMLYDMKILLCIANRSTECIMQKIHENIKNWYIGTWSLGATFHGNCDI